MAISTTIKKEYMVMKLEDLARCGHFVEYKDRVPFWNVRFDKVARKGLPTPITFLVGRKAYKFMAVGLSIIRADDAPLKYRESLTTITAYRIVCVPCVD